MGIEWAAHEYPMDVGCMWEARSTSMGCLQTARGMSMG